MAEGSACFYWDVAATSYGHGGVAQHFVHNDGGALARGVIVPGAVSRAFGGINEMDPTILPGYGSSNAPMAIMTPAREPPRARSSGRRLTRFKRSWTMEEDTYVENPTLDCKPFYLSFISCIFVSFVHDLVVGCSRRRCRNLAKGSGRKSRCTSPAGAGSSAGRDGSTNLTPTLR